jgi:uncharacterized protein YbjT (DUF2867 family)
MERIACIAGATGLIGARLVDALLEDEAFARVVTVGRRPLDRTHAKLTQITVDFAALDPKALPEMTDAFSALGTTMKQAGSREAFRAVDHDAVLAFGRAAMARGTRRFSVVTALGADPRSWTFYNKVKGETEEDLRAIGFESLAIVRPSLLVGDRTESRPGERVAIAVTSALSPLLRHLPSRPIDVRTVALALRAIAHDPPKGVLVYLSGELHALAGQ